MEHYRSAHSIPLHDHASFAQQHVTQIAQNTARTVDKAAERCIIVRSFVRSFVRSLAQTVLHTQQYNLSQAMTGILGGMYVSHTAMLAATAWLSFWSAITREERSKRLAGGASPSTDFIHLFRTSVPMPSLSAQMFFCCVSTLFALRAKGAYENHSRRPCRNELSFQTSHTTRTGQNTVFTENIACRNG